MIRDLKTNEQISFDNMVNLYKGYVDKVGVKKAAAWTPFYIMWKCYSYEDLISIFPETQTMEEFNDTIDEIMHLGAMNGVHLYSRELEIHYLMDFLCREPLPFHPGR